MQVGELWVSGDAELVVESVEEMRTPLREIVDARRHSIGVQRQPQYIHRWLEQVGEQPSTSTATASLASTRFQCRSTTSAG